MSSFADNMLANHGDRLSGADFAAAVAAVPRDVDWTEAEWNDWFRRWAERDDDGHRQMVRAVERRNQAGPLTW